MWDPVAARASCSVAQPTRARWMWGHRPQLGCVCAGDCGGWLVRTRVTVLAIAIACGRLPAVRALRPLCCRWASCLAAARRCCNGWRWSKPGLIRRETRCVGASAASRGGWAASDRVPPLAGAASRGPSRDASAPVGLVQGCWRRWWWRARRSKWSGVWATLRCIQRQRWFWLWLWLRLRQCWERRGRFGRQAGG